MTTPIYIGNDMSLSFSGDGKLTDDNGDALPGAIIQATLYEGGTQTQVSGQSWPLTLTDDGDGEYSGVLENTVDLIHGKKYELKIEAVASGAEGSWREIVEAKYRGFNQ